MMKHVVILTIIFIAAIVLTFAGIATAVGLFTTESHKVFADTTVFNNQQQGENLFNNQTINSTFSIK
jgi:hypothetical protein